MTFHASRSLIFITFMHLSLVLHLAALLVYPTSFLAVFPCFYFLSSWSSSSLLITLHILLMSDLVVSAFLNTVSFDFTQDMENKIRSTLNNIYFGKTRDIVNSLRSIDTLQDPAQKAAFQDDIRKALINRPKAQ